MIVTMRTLTERHSRGLDASAFAGLFAGLALLLLACTAPDLATLALPAYLILVPSLVFAAR